MEINLEKQHSTQGVIKISLKRADFQPAVDQKIKEYSKTANIKGFRPGKVPQGMIRKMYGNALVVEKINKLVSEKLTEYIKNSEIHFLGEPLPIERNESFEWETQEVFDFEYEVGFAEPFEIKVDKKVKMDRFAIKINDQVTDETIENLQREYGEIENSEVSTEKDTLHGKVTTKSEDFEKEIILDLRDAEKSTLKKLTGLKVGDEIEIDPKKGFKSEFVIKNQLRINDEEWKKLKKLSFKLEVIHHHKLAPLDQDFYDKTFGKDVVKDESEFREKVKEIVIQNYEKEEKEFFNYQVKEKLIESTKINLPDEFLKKWLFQPNDNVTSESLETEYENYSKRLKWSLISGELIKSNDLQVKHEEVVAEAKTLIKNQFTASGVGNNMDHVLDDFANSYLQEENGENYMKLHNQKQEEKIVKYIVDEITVKDKEVDLDEFRKL